MCEQCMYHLDGYCLIFNIDIDSNPKCAWMLAEVSNEPSNIVIPV